MQLDWTRLAFIFCFLTLGGPESSFANETQIENPFVEGVKSYQSANYQQAEKHFLQFLDQHSENEQALTNLGMTYFQLGQKGKALGYLRKALEAKPMNGTAKSAYQFVWDTLPVKEIPHQILWFENVRSNFLSYLDIYLLMALSLFSFFCWVWFFISYLAENRKRTLQELDPKSFPLSILFLSVLLLFLLTTLALKTVDQKTTRGTYIPEKGFAISAPEESAPSLFELFQGLELILEKKDNNYYFVTYPGGPSGWVKKDDIFVHKGELN